MLFSILRKRWSNAFYTNVFVNVNSEPYSKTDLESAGP